MAGEWIKMRRSLWLDGRVAKIADAINSQVVFASAARPQDVRMMSAARAQVVGALYALWSLADEYAEPDGTLAHFTRATIDAHVGIDGFCDALPPDWMLERDGVLQLPNYQEHNGETARRRATDARRKKRVRSASAKRPQSVRKTSAARPQNVRTFADQRREEKRREEKNRGEESVRRTPAIANGDNDSAHYPLSESEKAIRLRRAGGSESQSQFASPSPEVVDRLTMDLAQALRLSVPLPGVRTPVAIQQRGDFTDLQTNVVPALLAASDHEAIERATAIASKIRRADRPMAVFKSELRRAGLIPAGRACV